MAEVSASTRGVPASARLWRASTPAMVSEVISVFFLASTPGQAQARMQALAPQQWACVRVKGPRLAMTYSCEMTRAVMALIVISYGPYNY